MSDRSRSPTDEGSGDEIRPHGEHDSSEESEDDPEEYRRVADGFIVEGDDDDDEGEDGEKRKETKEERRARKKEEKRNRKRQKRKERGAELSDDELELINENRGIAGGPSLSRPLKRLRRRSGSDGDGEEEDVGRQDLRNMFADDEERLDEDDDDLGDFIEEDEEAAPPGETEDERRQRKREEKKLRREQAKRRPDVAGVDKSAWDEAFEVFGSGEDYDWALQGEDGIQDEDEIDPAKKDLRLEDVFDPSEIKARRLQDEDKTIASLDRPERHQLMNSTLSDNPVIAPDSLYPPPDLAAGYAYNKISQRTQYIFCGMHYDGSYPPPHEQTQFSYTPQRRPDLATEFIKAVSTALNMMFVQHLEVPYLWHYKRDVLSVLENEGKSSVQFLEKDELWALYNLGIKFRAVYERTQQVRETWKKIQARRPELQDRYLTETLLGSVCMLGIESAAEGVEWLAYHYAQDIREIKEEEVVEEGSKRLPERMAHDDMREGPIMTLVKAFGIDVSNVAVSFNDAQGQPHEPKDSDRAPADLAEEFAGTGTPYLTGEDALEAASAVIINELAKDPSIRLQAREFVKECADITVNPTERGMTVIDQYHTYYTFKFLTSKPANSFAGTPQWLHILKAEEEGLITISIDVADSQVSGFSGALERCCVSNDYGEVASKWNEIRRELCRDLTKLHLIPMGSKWVKEYLRSQAEDFVAERCRMELEFRINVKPYCGLGMEPGETPTVLALTNGAGDIRDAVIAVMLDDNGVVLTQTKFDNLKDDADREAFMHLVERKKPKVVAIGGLSVQTARLKDEVHGVLREIGIRLAGENPPISDTFQSHEEFTQALAIFDDRLRPYSTPLIVPNDATARMFMNSEEAAKEHPGLPLNGRYALALARFVQNPLNAYAKLGRRMLDITFMEYHQKLISQEKLLIHLERALVNSVCAMGIEINSCVADAYQRSMLPFISGLGPRKADSLVHAVGRAGVILNRIQFSESGLFGPTIFENVAGFLSIESDLENLSLEEANPQEQADPLDCTRIHPEDYEFAQKMCQDALDLDVEDVEGQHKSEVVQKLMTDEDRARKLSELNLDDFAYNLQRQGEGNKRHTLGEIVNELIQFRSDRRPPFYEPTPWEVVTMLTGETERSIGRGIRVSAVVRKPMAARAFCVLQSGIDAILDREYAADDENVQSCEDVVKKGQTLNAVILAVEPHRFQVRISIRSVDLAQSVPFIQPFVTDTANNEGRRILAEEAAAAKKMRSQGKAKRVINHPNWHVMNSGQAEQFLASQPRGEVVIRPSSKGGDHLALTFKLDEEVFQHVDIQEIDKPNEYALGRILRIGSKYTFGDLDDVIVNYVKAIMRMLEEAERSEKFRPEKELGPYLKNTLLAFPNRSMYGFCLNHEKPGYLTLAFLNKSSKDGGQIQEWPVRLLPGAYALNNAEVPGMNELCNAFKAQYSSRLSEQGAGGKTPGIRAGRTPAHGGRTPGMGGATPYGAGRTPAVGGATPYGAGGGSVRTPAMGGATPTPYGPPPGLGRTPVVGGATPYGPPGTTRTPIRPGMTPNAYGQAQAGPSRGPGQYGGATPYGPPGGAGGGYQGGSQGGMRPPGGPGAGMNAERAAMLARQGR